MTSMQNIKHDQLRTLANIIKIVDSHATDSEISSFCSHIFQALNDYSTDLKNCELSAEISMLSLSSSLQFIPPDLAFKNLIHAAESGYAPAQYEMAWYAMHHRIPIEIFDCQIDKITHAELEFKNDALMQDCERWLIQAAESGHLMAQFDLANKLLMSKDSEERNHGLRWLSKSARSSESSPEAKLEYAKRLEAREYGDTLNAQLIFQLYLDAANEDSSEAMLRMGKFYEEGNEFVAQDAAQALQWYALAAQNFEDIGHLKAGLLLLEIDKSSSNHRSDAINHLEMAAKAGLVDAMYPLGHELIQRAKNLNLKNFKDQYVCLERDIFSCGLNWLYIAADHNLLDAITELAQLYESGEINDGMPYWDEITPIEYLETGLVYYQKANEIQPSQYFQVAINRIQKELNDLCENNT